jgi:uncharacterized protein (DUF342 family)
MNLFGKKKAAPAPRLSDSISMLREAQNTLEKREKHLEKQVVAARDAAKEKLKAKDKRGAIHLLKRSKLLETQINQIYGKKANIDVQIMALESAASNKEIFDVMRQGKDALKAATATTSVHLYQSHLTPLLFFVSFPLLVEFSSASLCLPVCGSQYMFFV